MAHITLPAVAGLRSHFALWFADWRARRAERRATRRTRAALRGLGAAALKDLAINQSEIDSVAIDGSGERRRYRR